MGITSISVFTYCRIVPCNCRGQAAWAAGEGLRPQTRGRQERGPPAGKALHHGAAGGQPRQGHPLRAHSGPRVRERQWSEVWRWRGGGGAPRKGQPRGAVSVPSGGWRSPHPGPRPPCACVLQDPMSWGRGCRWGPGRARASRRPSCVPRPHSNQRGPQGPPAARRPVRRTGDNWPYDYVCLGWGGGQPGGGEAKLPGRQGRAEPACRTPSWRLRMVWRGRSPTQKWAQRSGRACGKGVRGNLPGS